MSGLFVEERTCGRRDALRDTHTTTDGDIESEQLLVIVEDGDVAEVVAEDVDIVVRRDRDRDLELARQVVFSVKRLDVLDCLTNDLLLVEPDLGVRGSLRLETVGELARKVENLRVQRSERRVRRAHLQ